MKKLMYGVAFAMIFASSAYGTTYQSALGFSSDVPSDWLILSQQQLQTQGLNEDDPKLIGMDRGLLHQVMDKIRSGGMEVYYHKGFGAGGFVNNINILQQNSKVPASDSELTDTCSQLPDVFSKYMGHPVSLYQCSLANVGGKAALLLEFDGAIQGTRCIQYQVQKSEGATLVVTGTFTNGTVEHERPIFTHIVTSMNMH